MRPYAVLAVCLLTLVGCTKSEPVAEKIPEKRVSNEPLKTYPLTGEVARLDPDAKIATIKHQAIGDWMGAMTMEFPVKDPADFAKLTLGEPVSATVHVQGLNYWVGEVQSASANSQPK
jgi:Cu/Ag efflux protein CusF